MDSSLLCAVVAEADAEGQGLTDEVRKARGLHHVEHGLPSDEGRNALRQVAVSAATISGDPRGSAGHDVFEVGHVSPVENRVGG